jgi:hypothetical protein
MSFMSNNIATVAVIALSLGVVVWPMEAAAASNRPLRSVRGSHVYVAPNTYGYAPPPAAFCYTSTCPYQYRDDNRLGTNCDVPSGAC